MICTKQTSGESRPWDLPIRTSIITVQEYHQSIPLLRKAKRSVKRARDHPQAHSAGHSALLAMSPGIVDNDIRSTENTYEIRKARNALRCPVANEFRQAQQHHSTLASTGCTKKFCQAGRAVHTDEPRVGENRSLEHVAKEAEGFLRELHRENFFDDDDAFKKRLNDVLDEIWRGSCEGIIRDRKHRGQVGGSWTHTQAELEFGIRRAWRNARKCIMRSHCDELKLCDLRGITSSAEMANALLENMFGAFNGGNVLPTVFVFPPRKANSRGPMVWNHQLLQFAGYEMEDGSILGDPMSAELTKAIIEIGWVPPSTKSRWDLLPLVVMADSDVPVMTELPSDLCKLVQIRHPRYQNEFEKLDLNWVAFPALTRLGFDIGGVQYTAAPFIGWFMDAEIGVRDLADTFRYNALPEVAKAIGLLDGKMEDGVEDLDDLQEYEQLSVLTRAQTELTYAVYWSYQQAKVSMSDTLTASMKWCRYDDEFKAKNGFRLPADPYWLAPPQGSIIPVWHRGGAPCYQPKPMISKHVQDPLKAWKREKQDWFVAAKPYKVVARLQPKRPSIQARSTTNDSIPSTWKDRRLQSAIGLSRECKIPKPISELQLQDSITVSIYFCSAGTFAEKIAVKLRTQLKTLATSIPRLSVGSRVEALENLQAATVSPNKVFLLVVSSTGQGEVPTNGAKFIGMCKEEAGKQLAKPSRSFRYSVYGNGDSRYAATYNGAAVLVERCMRSLGGLAIAGGLHQGDTAIQATALQALNPWWAKLEPTLQDLATDSPKLRRANSDDAQATAQISEITDIEAEAKRQLASRARSLLADFHRAKVINISPPAHEDHQGTHLLTLDLKDGSCGDMDCIQVLPVNAQARVRRALRALGMNGSTRMTLEIPEQENPTYSTFLTEYIDLELPCQRLEWLKNPDLTAKKAVDEERLRSLSCLESLEYLRELEILPAETVLSTSICLSLPQLYPRTYSVASSLSYSSPPVPNPSQPKSPGPFRNHLDILVKSLPKGRFSHTFLSSPTPTSLRYRLLPSSAAPLLTLPSTTPLIIIATGAGFAPVRCLLQRRIAATRTLSPTEESMISLFLGFKPADVPLFSGILNEAAAAGVLGSMSIVSSNEEQVRVYDRVLEEATRAKVREELLVLKGWVFVCTNPEAAKGTRGMFEEVLGKGGVEALGERWVEEVF